MKIKILLLLFTIIVCVCSYTNISVSAKEYVTVDKEDEVHFTIEEDGQSKDVNDVFWAIRKQFNQYLIKYTPAAGWILFLFGLLLVLFAKRDQSYRAWGLRIMIVIPIVFLIMFLAAHVNYSKLYWTKEDVKNKHEYNTIVYDNAKNNLIDFQIETGFIQRDSVDICRNPKDFVLYSVITYAPVLALLSFCGGGLVFFLNHNGTGTKYWGAVGLMIVLPITLFLATVFIKTIL